MKMNTGMEPNCHEVGYQISIGMNIINHIVRASQVATAIMANAMMKKGEDAQRRFAFELYPQIAPAFWLSCCPCAFMALREAEEEQQQTSHGYRCTL